MSLESREQILAALAQAVDNKQAHAHGAASIKTGPRWLKVDEPWGETERRSSAVAATLHRAKTRDQVRAVTRAIIDQHSIRRAAQWPHPLLEGLGFGQILTQCGVEIISDPSQADLGLTGAEALVADSGTLVLKTQKGWARATSLLPLIHLAVIRPEQRLAELADALALIQEWWLKDKRLPSAVSLATGPSLTADIEMTLITGVHGPGRVHVLVADLD